MPIAPRPVLAAGLAAALALGGAAFGQQPGGVTPDIERGAAVAQARCANCHAVALEAASPEKHAPQFRVLSRLYSAETLESKIAGFADHGHFEMPPVALREDEIAEVSAYIASLDGGAAKPKPPGTPT